jgi:hypothetical protein
MSPFVFNADLSHTAAGRAVREATVFDASDLFGDPLTRALYREDRYDVPSGQRVTCPIHLDWVADCADLHLVSVWAAA